MRVCSPRARKQVAPESWMVKTPGDLTVATCTSSLSSSLRSCRGKGTVPSSCGGGGRSLALASRKPWLSSSFFIASMRPLNCLVNGVKSARICRSSSKSSASPVAKLRARASLTTASMSAPVNPSSNLAASLTEIPSSIFLRRRWISRISSTSSSFGRPTLKSSSKRPLRRSSGGSASTALAVANTYTCARCSCIQVNMCASIRLPVPPSPSPVRAPSAFSSSSTQSTQGAAASAVANASRRFSSLCPTSPPIRAPTSRRKSGICISSAAILAARLLPQPGNPMRRTPRGTSTPSSRARSMSLKIFRRYSR